MDNAGTRGINFIYLVYSILRCSTARVWWHLGVRNGWVRVIQIVEGWLLVSPTTPPTVQGEIKVIKTTKQK